MAGPLTADRTAGEQTLAARLGPETLFGRTVADVRTWLLFVRTLAIVSGHPRSTSVVINDVDLIVDPPARLRDLIGWLEEMLITDPVSGGAAVKALRERMALRWGRWHGWDDDALTFAALSLGDGVIFAAGTLKGAPLSEAELADLHESVVAMTRLMGIEKASVPTDHRAFREYIDARILEDVDRRPLHDALAARPIPAPRYVPQLVWTAAQLSGRHVVEVVLGATLPEVTRERFGIQRSIIDRAEWAAVSLAMQAAGHLPRQVRLVPATRRRSVR